MNSFSTDFNPFMYFWTMYENNIAGRRGSSITVMEVIVPPFFIVLLFSWISILVSIEEYRFDQVKWWQRLAKSPVVFPAVDDNVPEFVSASGVAKYVFSQSVPALVPDVRVCAQLTHFRLRPLRAKDFWRHESQRKRTTARAQSL